MMILDDTAHWLIYLVAVGCVGALIVAVTDIIRRRRLASQLPPEVRPLFKRTGRCVIYVTAAAIASWIVITSMFYRFHAVVIAPDHVELVYFWPRPAVSIQMGAVDRVELVPYRRRGGYLQVASGHRVFRSVDFGQMTVAREIRSALAERMTTPSR